MHPSIHMKTMKKTCHRLTTRFVTHPALAAAAALVLLGLTMAAEPVAPGQVSPATAAVDAIGQKMQQAMVWSPSAPAGQQAYVAFRKTFNLGDVPKAATLHLFADSRYMLWVNGRYVLRGPCRFHPKRPEYDSVDIAAYLRKGSNTIAVLGHNYFGAVNGRIMSHAPGFAALLEIPGNAAMVTDATWRCNARTRYQPSPVAWSSIPDIIDARINDGEWMGADFDDAAWEKALAVDGKQWGPMGPRQIPLPAETELKNMKLLPSNKTLAEQLPVELKGCGEILIDLGRMAMSYADVDLDADPGSVLHISYALRFVNGAPAEGYGGGATYTARGGRQSFVMGDVWGARYVTVRCESGRVTLHGLKMIDRRYPFTRVGTFKCNDEIFNQLWENSIHTIEVATDDAYGVDARERGEWLQDPAQPNYLPTRIALAGPDAQGKPVYSDSRLFRNLLLRATYSQRPDGQVMACFPTDRNGDCHDIIEDYSLQWVEALRVYFEATGDKAFVRQMWPTLTRLVKWFTDHRSPNGMVMAREYTSFDNPLAYITCEGATLNAFFYQALCDAADLGTAIGEKNQTEDYAKQAVELAAAYNKHLWNATEAAYNSAIYQGKNLAPTAHAQLLALDRGIVPADRVASVRKWFLSNYKNPGGFHCGSNPDFETMVANKAGINMPLTYYWIFLEFYRMNTPQMDQTVLDEIRRRWTAMVKERKDTGTVTEMFLDVLGGCESCHNYGAVPAYFLSSYVLGVRLDGPVWRKSILIEPRLGDLQSAEGVVSTEFGPVKVEWKMTDGSLGFGVTVPDGATANVRLPRLADTSKLTIDGKARPDAKTDGRFITVTLPAGSHTGQVSK